MHHALRTTCAKIGNKIFVCAVMLIVTSAFTSFFGWSYASLLWKLGFLLWPISVYFDLKGDDERCDPRDPQGVYGCELVTGLDKFIYACAFRHRRKDGMMYISDLYASRVYRIKLGKDGRPAPGAALEDVVEVTKGEAEARADGPGGLGFVNDKLHMVLPRARKVAQVVGEGKGATIEVCADVSAIERERACDLCVSQEGRRYVSGFGSAIPKHVKGFGLNTSISMIDADNKVSIAARQLKMPTGVVLTPDGKTMLIAEMFGHRITAFDVDPGTGELSRRRVWAEFEGVLAHGICLDAEGCLWVSVTGFFIKNCFISVPCSMMSQGKGFPCGGFLRVKEGGEIVDFVLLKEGTGTALTLVERDGGGGRLYMSVSFVSAEPEEKILATDPGNSIVLAKDVAIGPALSGADPNYNAGYC